MKIRLHLLAIPYTITRNEYSSCAFTGKVQRFSPMMRSRGFEVYHYGIETSQTGANVDIDLMTVAEWNELRIKTFQFLEPNLSYKDAEQKNNDPTIIPNILARWDSPIFVEFNKRLAPLLKENYRSQQTDIVCISLGKSYEDALCQGNYVCVETGIGYHDSYKNYRIFESHSWFSHEIGVTKQNPPNYWFVIPNSYDLSNFKLNINPSINPNNLTVGFLGRVCNTKGCHVIVEIAKRFPHITFVLCGPGYPSEYIKQHNVVYKNPVYGEEKSDYLGSCIAFLCPSEFMEPFCGVAVEAQLCGTPVITADHGGFTETVEQFKTGLRCHTLADYCYGIQMAIDGKFDRKYIHEYATNKYDMYKVAYQYEYVLKSILDIHIPGRGGWFSKKSYYQKLLEGDSNSNSKIYLIIPYYGQFPNYFQLYLDSLQMNKDILTVIMPTDIDLSNYNVPSNLIPLHITLDNIRERLSKLLLEFYGKTIEPNELLHKVYKLVDIKITYPVLFDDILQNIKVSSNDFIGWGDIDLIYGKLENFIDFEEKYDIIGGWFGHFTAIKNIESFKKLFFKIPDYDQLVIDNQKVYIADEINFRQPLIDYLKTNNCNMFYMNAHFCDIVPPCFYYLFRPDHESRSINFFNASKPEKNIKNLFYNKLDGTLTTTYEDGETQDTTYCHLQKRTMELPHNITNSKNGYYIKENKFSLNGDIPLTVYMFWNDVKLPEYMQKNVDNMNLNLNT